jgi:hypothetical protein
MRPGGHFAMGAPPVQLRLIKIARALRHPVAYARLQQAMRAGLPLMYDDVSPYNIPASAGIVAGYVDGLFAWSAAGWDLFPNALHVPITVLGMPNVKVCDCETGDLSPTGAAQWAATEVQAGRRPTIYCNTSTLPAVIVALQVFAGLQFMRDVDWWQAQYDGVATLEPYYGVTPVAKQFAGYPGNSSGPYDVSITNGVWPAVVMPPPPAPDPPAATALPGGGPMAKACVARRPNVPAVGGTNDGADIFSIDPSGKIWQRGDAPDDWNQGAKVEVPWIAGTVKPDSLTAAWRLDGSAVDLWVTDANGTVWLNAWGPSTTWHWGAWDIEEVDVAL